MAELQENTKGETLTKALGLVTFDKNNPVTTQVPNPNKILPNFEESPNDKPKEREIKGYRIGIDKEMGFIVGQSQAMERVFNQIDRIIENPAEVERMSKSASGFARRDAAHLIAEEIVNIALEHEK